MRYAVMQKHLEPPALERLQRAFRAVPCLTPADAHILGNDAFGILVKNFSEADAGTLQAALTAEGVETEIAPETSLPAIPQARMVSRAECGPDALLVYDPAGRKFPVEWQHVMLIAAGRVRMTDFKRVETVREITRVDWQGFPRTETVTDSNTREERNDHLLVEIVLSRAVLRYSIRAEKFNFDYLGPRRSKNLPDNFALLIQDLAKFAPHAALNRGAFCLQEKPDQIFSYPSKNAFFEEIIWLLWQLAKVKAG